MLDEAGSELSASYSPLAGRESMMISVDTQKELAGETWDLNRYQAWYEWRDGDTGEAVEVKLRHAYAESLSQDSAVASLRTIRAPPPRDGHRGAGRPVRGSLTTHSGRARGHRTRRPGVHAVRAEPRARPGGDGLLPRAGRGRVAAHTEPRSHPSPELLAGIPAPSKDALGTFLCSPLLDVIVRQTGPTPDEVTDVESRLVPT